MSDEWMLGNLTVEARDEERRWAVRDEVRYPSVLRGGGEQRAEEAADTDRGDGVDADPDDDRDGGQRR